MGGDKAKADYLVFEVHVGDESWSGTNDRLTIKAYGSDHTTGFLTLDNPNKDDLEHGKTSLFVWPVGRGRLQKDPGDVYAITLQIEPKSSSKVDALHLYDVRVHRLDGKPRAGIDRENRLRFTNQITHHHFPMNDIVLGDAWDGSSHFEFDRDIHEITSLVDEGIYYDA